MHRNDAVYEHWTEENDDPHGCLVRLLHAQNILFDSWGEGFSGHVSQKDPNPPGFRRTGHFIPKTTSLWVRAMERCVAASKWVADRELLDSKRNHIAIGRLDGGGLMVLKRFKDATANKLRCAASARFDAERRHAWTLSSASPSRAASASARVWWIDRHEMRIFCKPGFDGRL